MARNADPYTQVGGVNAGMNRKFVEAFAFRDFGKRVALTLVATASNVSVRSLDITAILFASQSAKLVEERNPATVARRARRKERDHNELAAMPDNLGWRPSVSILGSLNRRIRSSW